MDLSKVNIGANVGIVYFGGQPDPKVAKRTVKKVLKNHIILSDDYKYRKENGRCINHDYVIVEVN